MNGKVRFVVEISQNIHLFMIKYYEAIIHESIEAFSAAIPSGLIRLILY